MAKKRSANKSSGETPSWDPSDVCLVDIPTLVAAIKREGIFSYDLETTGLDPRNHSIEGVAFYVPNEKDPTEIPLRAWFPFKDGTMDHTVDAVVRPLRDTMPQQETMEQLRQIWELEDVVAVRHNGIFDDAFLYLSSGLDEPIVIKNIIADSMLADYVADERRKRYGLKFRVNDVFGHKMTTYNEAVGGQAVFGFANKKPLGVYACDDTAWTYRLFKWAIESIRIQDPPKPHNGDWCSPLDNTPGTYSDLEKIFWQIEMKIQRILMEMEITGCFIDWQWLVTVQERVQRQQQEILDEFKETVGWVPNLRSPKQVSDFLYKAPKDGGLGVPTKGVDYNEDLDQYATGDKALKHRKEQFPLVGKLLKYRSLSVIDNSFCKKLIEISQASNTHRVHARFRQTGTVIGRLSSADPVNLMNQPRDKDLIRKAFCAHLENDYDPERAELCLIDADYGQMELRMAAHLAGEKNMIEVYTNVGGCTNGENGAPCERYTYYECFQCHKKGPPTLTPSGDPRCAGCGASGSDIEHQKRCRHVDLHQRTSEDVGVPRNPLAKCLDGSTLVLGTRLGANPVWFRPSPIEDLVGDICPNEHRVIPTTTVATADGYADAHTAIKRHNRPTKIIVTKRAVVIATEDHRFQVIGDYDSLDPSTPSYVHVPGRSLVEARNLEKGMALPYIDMAHAHSKLDSVSGVVDGFHKQISYGELRINPFTKEVDPDGPASIRLDEKWAYFAGIFAGDGCASGNACSISHGHTPEYANWRNTVRSACDAIGLPTSTRSDKRQTAIGSRVVRRYLSGLRICEELGKGDQGAKIMRVPPWVLSGGPKMMWSYIAGVFDTDGTVGKEKSGTASFTTKSPEFAGQMAFMLRWLGMPVLVQPGYNKTYERWYYTIHILGEGLERFLRYCPMRFTEKVDRLRERASNIKRKCAPTSDEVLLVIDGGERTVYDFQIDTEDHLYNQGGLVGHNNANFGLLYRMGAPKFCIYAGLFDEQGDPRLDYGQELIEKWHQAYPGIAVWHDRTVQQLLRDNYIAYNIARRRRRLDLEWKINDYRAGTQAIQFRVSGSCQDLIKLAMIRIYETREKKIANSRPAEAKLWRRYRFLIQVHDELIFEGPKAIKAELCALVKDSMEGVATGMRVPFVADARAGRTWDELH
ncbi:MAG: DNA polymerase [Nitrospira sp.]